MTETQYKDYIDELWKTLHSELSNEDTAIGKAKLVFLILDGVTVEDLVRAGIDLGRARTLIFQNFLPNKLIRRVVRRVYEVTPKGEKEFRKPPRKRGRPVKLIKAPAGLSATTHIQLLEGIRGLEPILRRVTKLVPTEERESIRFAAGTTLREIEALKEYV